jgi:preprotein translocase subunit SecG
MQVLNIFHVLVAIALIAFVLIQRGQGATAGAAFGSGASGTVFGSRGAGNFLSRSTWVLAALFCAISLTMAIWVSRIMSSPDTDLGVVSTQQTAPATEETQSIGIGEDAMNQTTVGPAEPVETDIPSFDAVGDDLPVLDSATGEAVEGVSGDDLPAIDDGEDSPGPGADDS